MKTKPEEETGSELIPPTGTALEVIDFGEDAGAGLEDMRADELLTPFLALLQPLSPQLDRSSGVYIPEAHDGMLVNTLTGELYNGEVGLDIIPVARNYMYGEWVPRDDGGGFRGKHSPEEPLVMQLKREQGEFKSLKMLNGNDLIEQYDLYALVGPAPITVENHSQVVIGFTSTKITVYKRLMSRISQIRYPINGVPQRPPIYAHRWHLTTVQQSNKKGRFWNLEFALSGGEQVRDSLIKPDQPLYQIAKHFSDMIRQGKVQANYGAATEAGTVDDDTPPF